MSFIVRKCSLCVVFGLFLGAAFADAPEQPQDTKKVLLYPVKEDDGWKFINREGKVVIGGPFDYARSFREGLAKVQIGAKNGFIDKTGKLVIAPKFDSVGNFSEGMAPAKSGNKWGYIDRRGRMVIEPKFGPITRPFSEGLAAVSVAEDSDSWGFIDKTGEFVTETRFRRAGDFSEGLAPVSSGGKRGYVDRKGRMVIELSFEMYACPFSEGLAAVMKGFFGEREVFFIDKSGKPVLTFDASVCSVGAFSEGLASISYLGLSDNWTDQKTGFIDKQGRVVIEPFSAFAQPFSEGLAEVTSGEKSGYINRKGELVIPMTFDRAGPFENGVAEVWIDGNIGYIDRTGRYIWDPTKGQAAQGGAQSVSGIPMYVAPYYYSDGPKVAVGRFSKALSASDRETLTKNINEMKKQWKSLPAEAMYVASIRLYDMGLKDEAVYWFYSAAYRAHLFLALRSSEDVGSLGDPAFELKQAHVAFHQLAGEYINGYGFGNLKKLVGILQRVISDGKKLTPLKTIYPNVQFKAEDTWASANGDVAAGVRKLIDYVEKDADEIRAMRKKNGMDGKY